MDGKRLAMSGGQGVRECLAPPVDRRQAFEEEFRERIYQSSKLKPLGRPVQRGQGPPPAVDPGWFLVPAQKLLDGFACLVETPSLSTPQASPSVSPHTVMAPQASRSCSARPPPPRLALPTTRTLGHGATARACAPPPPTSLGAGTRASTRAARATVSRIIGLSTLSLIG